MSWWHSPQAAESMKKFDGMIPPTLVAAEEGKKGDFGPPPSSVMEVGTIRGLRMWSSGFGLALRYSLVATGKRTSSTTAAAKAWRNRSQPPPWAPRRQIQAPTA